MHPPERLGVTVRRGRLYVDVADVALMLRHRAAAYRTRAEDLTRALADPASPVDESDVGLVPTLDEALACRMVAEELEQRADVLDGIG